MRQLKSRGKPQVVEAGVGSVVLKLEMMSLN